MIKETAIASELVGSDDSDFDPETSEIKSIQVDKNDELIDTSKKESSE